MPRLLHITDVHFGGEIPEAVEATLAFAEAHPPDLVLVTGDITLNGLPSEFEAAAAWLARFPGPRLVTPGNHDTPYWNLLLRALVPFQRYRRHIGEPRWGAWTGDGVIVRTINSARGAQPRPDWSKGAVSLKQVENALDAFAGAAPGALRVVACHHPLIEAIGAPVTGGVRRGHAAAERMAEAGVDLIVTGHVHNPFAVPLPFGDQRTYAVGGGTLSARLRGTPPSINTISIDDGCVEVVAQAWRGSHFEPYRDWSLPRRKRA